MEEEKRERIIKVGEYFVNTQKTIREVAVVFGLSKSSVHIDLSKRLKYVCPALYEEARAILDSHLQERHIRGGNATKEKYEKLKEISENSKEL